jgi:hypothetical protein
MVEAVLATILLGRYAYGGVAEIARTENPPQSREQGKGGNKSQHQMGGVTMGFGTDVAGVGKNRECETEEKAEFFHE